MIKICRWLAVLVLSSVSLPGCSAGEQADDSEQRGQLQLKLPKPLREISGLTLLSEGTLLAMGDEKAHIYSIDFNTQQAKKFAKFGDPVAKGDFEGITLLRDEIYLVTSSGTLWRRVLDAEPNDYETFRTGIGKHCEVEGLTAWPQQDVLLILCKTPRTDALAGKLSVFAWSVQKRELQPALAIHVAYKDMGLPELHPSAITLTADEQGLFIIAAREHYFIETTLQGELIRGAGFPNAATHKQAEGVVISAENTLYLADEGGKGRGRVTRYEPSF